MDLFVLSTVLITLRTAFLSLRTALKKKKKKIGQPPKKMQLDSDWWEITGDNPIPKTKCNSFLIGAENPKTESNVF